MSDLAIANILCGIIFHCNSKTLIDGWVFSEKFLNVQEPHNDSVVLETFIYGSCQLRQNFE